MVKASEEAIFTLVCKHIREAGFLTDEQKLQLTQRFGGRFTHAYAALEERKVKKYVFHPSGRVVWIVTGKEQDYQILPLANFCSCLDFYFRVISHETSLCYHLIAQKLSVALKTYIEVAELDTRFEPLMGKWREVRNRKREFSVAEVENVRKLAVAILSEAKKLPIDRLVNELRETGFTLTRRHLANILRADKARRFKYTNALWGLDQ